MRRFIKMMEAPLNTNAIPTDDLQTTMETEWSALLNLSRATLAVDQLGEYPEFHPVTLDGALDTLKTEFVEAHTARLEAARHA